MQAIPVAARILFGLLLAVAGHLKLHDPLIAASSLLFIGLDLQARLLLVGLVAMTELLVGAFLVVRPCNPSSRWFGASLGGALIVASLVITRAVGSDCGCFGALTLPVGLVQGALIVGCVACLVKTRATGDVPCRRPLDLRALAFFGAIILPAAIPLLRGTGIDAPRLSLADLVHADSGIVDFDALIVSAGCPHCEEALDRLAESVTSGAPPRESVPFLTIVRRSDLDPVIADRPDLRPLVVPDELWWALIDTQPPIHVRYRRGRPVADEDAGR